MKNLFKKLAIFLLVFNFIALPLIGCGDGQNTTPDKEIEGVTFEDATFGYNGQDHTLLVTGELPEGVTATYENNVQNDFGTYEATCTLSGNGYITKTLKAKMTICYDDQGLYDEDAYAFRNKLSDDTLILTENEKKGVFGDGVTSEVLFVNPTDINDNSKVKVSLNGKYEESSNVVDAYYITSEELKTQKGIKTPFLGKDQNGDSIYLENDGYLVMDTKTTATLSSSNKYRYLYLSMKPSCTKEEFLQGDYLEFYMYFDAVSNGNNDGSEIRMYFGGNLTHYNDNGGWVYVKIPLNVYKSPKSSDMYNFITSKGTKGVKTKEDFYEYLCSEKTFLYFRTELKHLATQDTPYKVYFTDMKLKVDTPDEGVDRLRNNFTKLTVTKTLPELNKVVLKNIFPRYINGLTTSNVVTYDGFEVIKMPIGNNSVLNYLVYIHVNSCKTYKQLEQYDCLAVTMRIESENPYAYLAKVTLPGDQGASKKTLAKFSANKWITFEIPIEYILKMVSHMENNNVYDLTGTYYTWSNPSQELFYITYERIINGNLVYAEDLYNSNRTSEWKQYPMTIYLKSLKLIKKETA